MTRRLGDAIKSVGAGGAWVFDALVEAFDPARGTVSVTIQPQGIEVDGLPYFTPLTTGPWKWIALPKVGATVKVTATDPDMINADTAYVVGAQWDEDDTPPSGYEAGDVLLAHDDGPKLLLQANGKVKLYSGDIELGDDSAVEICKRAVAEKLNDFIESFNGHTQIGAFGIPTTPPVIPETPLVGGLTTKVKAT